MSKTIKQIADEIGVSKQAVQKRISREPLYTCLYPYISTVAGTKYIEVVGENMIKKAFHENDRQPVVDNQPITNEEFVYSDVYSRAHTSKDLFETLQKELEIKNKQIEELNARLAETTTALVTAQETVRAAQALHAGTIQKQLDESSVHNQKEGFWKKYFQNGKKKNNEQFEI